MPDINPNKVGKYSNLLLLGEDSISANLLVVAYQ